MHRAPRASSWGEFAARANERTQHGAQTLPGSPNVMIGTPSASGCCGRLKKICEAMRAARHPPPGALKKGVQIPPNGTGQSYHNCGLDATRQILWQVTGSTVSQEELYYWAHEKGLIDLRDANGNPVKVTDLRKRPDLLYRNGGTDCPAALEAWGIRVDMPPNSAAEIVKGVEEGKGVIAGVHGDLLWDGIDLKGDKEHGVLVTGVERDREGRIVSYVINDTGADPAKCGQRVPAARFEGALIRRQSSTSIVTRKPIW